MPSGDRMPPYRDRLKVSKKKENQTTHRLVKFLNYSTQIVLHTPRLLLNFAYFLNSDTGGLWFFMAIN
jgi:hypothetical protein